MPDTKFHPQNAREAIELHGVGLFAHAAAAITFAKRDGEDIEGLVGEKYGDGYPLTLFEDDARTYRPVYEALASWREDHVEYFGSGAHALLQAARQVGVNLTDYVSLADLAEIRSRADSYEKQCDEECSPGSAPYHQPDIQSDGE